MSGMPYYGVNAPEQGEALGTVTVRESIQDPSNWTIVC